MKHLSLIALFAVFSAFSVSAATLPDAPHIVVTGTAKMDIYPDQATISIDINKTETTLELALQDVDKRLETLITFLNKKGIKSKDIDYSSLRTGPKTEYDRVTQKQVITGYFADRDIVITMRDLKDYNRFMHQLSELAVDAVNLRDTSSSKQLSYDKQLRKQAIELAQKEAQVIAKELSVNLGQLYTAYEGSSDHSTYNDYERVTVTGSRLKSADFNPGKQTIEATYTLVYYISE